MGNNWKLSRLTACRFLTHNRTRHTFKVDHILVAPRAALRQTPEWLDTVNVRYDGTVDLVMDFTDPVIRGVSLFHCHLLSHEAKWMMARILSSEERQSLVSVRVVSNVHVLLSSVPTRIQIGDHVFAFKTHWLEMLV